MNDAETRTYLEQKLAELIALRVKRKICPPDKVNYISEKKACLAYCYENWLNRKGEK